MHPTRVPGVRDSIGMTLDRWLPCASPCGSNRSHLLHVYRTEPHPCISLSVAYARPPNTILLHRQGNLPLWSFDGAERTSFRILLNFF